MRHWREISAEPNAAPVREFISAKLSAARLDRIEDSGPFLADFVRERTVLDIGVVGHVIERSTGSDWKHGLIKRHARRVVGVDILDEAVQDLRARGYDVRVVDATSDADLGERFERIVLGDVIEHVDNPVKLLLFAARHLAPGGRIMCTTPNPFYVGTVLEMIQEGTVIANAEHTCWITPSNALELARRANLELVAFHHFGGTGNNWMRRSLISVLRMTGLLKYELFSRAYIYVFSKPNS